MLDQTNDIPVFFLMGPTAVGKSDLAIQLASQLPIEIVNVDSALIYRSMDIGTGKPSEIERAKIPHHLIDILDPAESYSVNQFCVDAKLKIQNILAKNKIPLLVGGTMLYFYTLKYGISSLPERNEKIRQQLEIEKNQKGLKALHDELTQIDAPLANKIHPNDPQRLLRALEIYRVTRQAPSCQFKKWLTFLDEQKIVEIALLPSDRTLLHERIAKRFHDMLQRGFVEEVANLKNRDDLNLTLPAMRCVGYRQIWQYLEQQLSYSEMIERAIIATRQLAKRQLTWLRKFSDTKIFFREEQNLHENVYRFIFEILADAKDNHGKVN